MYTLLFLIIFTVMVIADSTAVTSLRKEGHNYRHYARWSTTVYLIVAVVGFIGGVAWAALAFMGVNAYMAVDSSRIVRGKKSHAPE